MYPEEVTDANAAASPRRAPGTVYLVGSGPGDVGLLTLRAARLLKRADVVVHDALVGEDVLDLVPASAERIDVGKRCGGRRTRQEQINQLLVELGREHPVVVRLKGGDPFVFGRGGEEALALREAGVRFRVVPGVTAAVGVSAYAGIPLTHRDFASSVTFVTGHEEGHRKDGRVDWEALARLEGTLVVYMGVGGLGRIARTLIAAGRAPETPAAIVEWGTHARQRTVTASLDRIEAAATEAGIGAPALVVIGEVAALRDRLAWFDRRPLRGVRVLVGRSRPQPSRIARAIARLGAEVHEYPRLRAAPAPRTAPIDDAFRTLPSADWVLFTSPAAVRRFWAEAAERRLDARCLAGARVAALGHATGTALARVGILADVRTRTFDTAAVAAELEAHTPLDGARILFPREGHLHSPVAADLRARGATVDEVEIFRTLLVEGPESDLPEVDVIVLPSSTAARTVAAARAEGTRPACVVAIGPATAAAAAEAGLSVDVVCDAHTLDSVVEAVRGVAASVRTGPRAGVLTGGPLSAG